MNESHFPDDPLDALLHASAPESLPDGGFVARTMTAVDQAERAKATQRRTTPVAPIVIARALAAEHRRHEAQARLWRWAAAGVVAGFVLLVAAVVLSPDGSLTIAAPTPQQWYPLCLLLAFGAVWYAWRESRRN
jgi:peptidoglycan/LPS O-acetylase OafA/YrhL